LSLAIAGFLQSENLQINSKSATINLPEFEDYGNFSVWSYG